VFVKPGRILHAKGGSRFSLVFSTLPIGQSAYVSVRQCTPPKSRTSCETRNFSRRREQEVYRPNCRGVSDKTHRLLVIHPCTGECRACIVKLPWLSDLHGTTTTCRCCRGLESRTLYSAGDPDLDGPTHAFMSASQGGHRPGVILSSGIHESFPIRPVPLRP
jgi:hypothetical protein